MHITYDPEKNDRNIQQRGLSFDRVAELEWDTAISQEDTRKDYGERRIQVFGLLQGRLHAAVITMRGLSLHVISFRKANAREVRRYGRQRAR